MNYANLFKDRLLLLTGVGRSGTTILGKLLSSMTPAYLVFEPALFKYATPNNEWFLGILFEDYFLPIIQGRGNWNSRDWSSIHHQMTFEDILYRWDNINRRSEALLHFNKEDPLLIVKSLEYQNKFRELWSAVPSVRSIEIIRDGRDVVQSAVERGWFTDDWCNNQMIQKSFFLCKCVAPDYIAGPEDDFLEVLDLWPEWNPWTRAACAWRILRSWGNEMSNQHGEQCSNVKYESLIDYPDEYVEMYAYKFNLKPTGLTKNVIKQIVEHRPAKRKPLDLNIIEQPERKRFVEENQKLGYN